MRNNKKIAAVAGLAAMMAVGGTFAYFNQKLTVVNPFDTGKYDSVMTEDFKPAEGENWEPGTVVNKDITVKNTGNYDVLVRVKFDETWVNKDNTDWKKTNLNMDDTTKQDNTSDGLIEKDGSVVKKTLNKDNWVYSDGYWYYKSNLAAGTDTGVFLDAVQLLEDADMGRYTVTNYYTKAEAKPAETEIGESDADADTKWVVYTDAMPKDAVHTMSITSQDTTAPGYGNADYTLTITAETVQATKAAMEATFKLDADTLPEGLDWSLE